MLNLFVSLNGVAVVSQVLGLYITMQLVVHMDRVSGSVGAAAYMSYPGTLQVAAIAYSLSFGVNIIATLLTICVVVVATFPWPGIIAPALFLAVTFAAYIAALSITNKAHTYADKVVTAAAKQQASLSS